MASEARQCMQKRWKQDTKGARDEQVGGKGLEFRVQGLGKG